MGLSGRQSPASAAGAHADIVADKAADCAKRGTGQRTGRRRIGDGVAGLASGKKGNDRKANGKATD